MFPESVEFILKKLKNRILPLFLPLPNHLIREAWVEYSYNYSNNFQKLNIEFHHKHLLFYGELPIKNGESIQYRFSGKYKHQDGLFFIGGKDGNFDFKLPSNWNFQRIENIEETIYQTIDSGKIILLGDDTTLKKGGVLFNLLGASSLSDCITRGNNTLHHHTLSILLAKNMADTFFEYEKIGWKKRKPTKYFAERIDDGLIKKQKEYRLITINDNSPLQHVFSEFDKNYYFPLLGLLEFQKKSTPLSLNRVDIISNFFSTYIDTLLIDHYLISRN